MWPPGKLTLLAPRLRGWCYDASSCSKRKMLTPFLTSSKYQSPVHEGKGILSDKEDESPLFAAAKAYVAYCTSDAHMGSRQDIDPASGFFFRGADVIRAVVRDIVAREVRASSMRRKDAAITQIRLFIFQEKRSLFIHAFTYLFMHPSVCCTGPWLGTKSTSLLWWKFSWR